MFPSTGYQLLAVFDVHLPLARACYSPAHKVISLAVFCAGGCPHAADGCGKVIRLNEVGEVIPSPSIAIQVGRAFGYIYDNILGSGLKRGVA